MDRILSYNTELKRLKLPEYGRNIQNMVNHCMTIEDREERTCCANAIINTMGNLFPDLRDINDFKHILWDHLAIMSDFKLDIDYPYEVIKKETLFERPENLIHSASHIKYMHYGKTIPQLIEKVPTIEDEEERNQLIYLIANHMKKCYSTFNKDGVNDKKIFDDLRELSRGAIDIKENEMTLMEYKDIPAAQKTTTSKKKKK
ncbi:MAG: DUF4290 domain-containing protein [Paludibacteraceae bacterium]|nr:DUF4290 domain-containing protein [Paludibacteraceae bacterium]MBR4840867.1 DUF4290 domain-containing protein [Paludibacteraceae bacterium]